MEARFRWMRAFACLLSLVGLLGLAEAVLLGSRASQDAVLSVAVWPWFLLLGVSLDVLLASRPLTGHWHKLLDQLTHSPLALYQSVEVGLQTRDVPNCSTSAPALRQRGVLGTRRRHLRVVSGSYQFDLYATQYGRSLGVAWRCYRKTALEERILLGIPLIGWLGHWLLYRETTYQQDQALFFQDTVHSCVAEALQSALRAAELLELGESELRPTHADMLKRWS